MAARTTLEIRVLQRAAELLGSEQALARSLRVPRSALAAWLSGVDTPPRSLFLQAVDLLVEAGDTSALDPARPAAEAVPPPAAEPKTPL